jgi:hypothetical protein
MTSTPTAPSSTPDRHEVVSPLGRLEYADRTRVIGTITASLPADAAVAVLAALSGSDAEVRELPEALQARAQDVIMAALPAGLNAVVASRLGLAAGDSEAWLKDLDARFTGMSVDEVIAALREVRSAH